MAKVRSRKTNKANWTMDDLERAIKLIIEQNYSIRKAAKTMNIPFASLHKRYKKKFDKAPRLGRKTVFTPEMEKEFADLIKKMANIFYGCTPNKIKRAAFEYAEALNLKHDFNKSTRLAGRVWFEGFISRNNISVRKPEATSINRVTAFNKTEVDPFKAAYRRECDLFMKSQLSQRITPYDVDSLVKKAFSNVASMSKAEAGFKATGIFPINPNVFSDEDFIAAEVLQSEPIVVQDLADSISGSPSVGAVASVSSITATVELERNSPIPSTSTFCPTTSERANAPLSQFDTPSTSKDLPSVQNLIQMPKKATVVKTRKGRQKQHATILTSTPIKDSLVKKENKRKAKAVKTQGKGKGIGKKSKPQEISLEKVKKKILQDSNDTSMSDVNTDELCQDDENDDTEDASDLCLVCGEFGRNNEKWYRCTSCGLWAHADCTGWDSAHNYVCDMC